MNLLTLTQIETNKEWVVNVDAIDALIRSSKGGTEITLRSGTTVRVQQTMMEIEQKIEMLQNLSGQ